MRRQSLNFDNLGATLGAARNATKRGTQQFETPRDIAVALAEPLPAYRAIVLDLTCGHGALTAGVANRLTRHAIGVDIDPTAAALPPHWRFDMETKAPEKQVIIGDLQLIAPLLREVNFQCDLIVGNPPFSLQWKEGDSTLVFWRMMHEFTTAKGEGMMICNEATARRLIAPTEEARRIWLWVTLPNFFPGTARDMEIAVIYFAKDHQPEPGEPWIEMRLPSALPDAILASLRPFAHSRTRHIRGQTVAHFRSHASATLEAWSAVRGEWRRQEEERATGRDGFNILLRSDGRLDAWLTPFQGISGKVPLAIAKELQMLNGRHPAALVVQKTSRMALQRAVNGGIWRVQPGVMEAVAAAVREYQRIRAPFTRLNDVQRLGYLDEEDFIECRAANIPGFTPGKSYPISTETFEGKKVEERKRGSEPNERESVLVSGQELAILVTDDIARRHCFTQYPAPTSDGAGELRPPASEHHLLSDLVASFIVPEVPDVATLNPEAYRDYKIRLLALER